MSRPCERLSYAVVLVLLLGLPWELRSAENTDKPSPAPKPTEVPTPPPAKPKVADKPAPAPAPKPASAPTPPPTKPKVADKPAPAPAPKPASAPTPPPAKPKVAEKPAPAPAPKPASAPTPPPTKPKVAEKPAPPHAPDPFVGPLPLKTESQIDRLVMAKLRPHGIQPTLCSDAVFVRRAYLDLVGIPPTGEEARAFIENPDAANKRKALIERLLSSDEFSVYWAMKWGDLLRIKAEFPINLWPNAAQLYHRWVVASLRQNKPYDQFVRELLTSSGSNYRVGPVNFYRALPSRAPDGIASGVALTFMGSRTEKWPQERLAGMSVFFSQIGYKPTSEWKEEYVFWDPTGSHAIAGNAAPGRASIAEIGTPFEDEELATTAAPAALPKETVLPDGTTVALPADRDPREVFADWLVSPENPWFTRAIANRVWSWLMGRGIVHEADDLRDDNPPSHPELLAYLEKELIGAEYDLKHLYRLILNSETYQFASVAGSPKPEAEALFAAYPMRRLEAEVLIDAINRVTGTTELYTSPIPEPFTYIPQGQPAVSIGDGSITSPFLSLFGRSARATGTEGERTGQVVPGQWLHLLNSSHIQEKLENGPGIKALVSAKRPVDETIAELYLAILSRHPSPEEIATARAYCGLGEAEKPDQKTVRPEHWTDLAWALLNTHEFVFRH